MKTRTEIIDGKKRVIITRSVSGEDRAKDAVLFIMGPGYEYDEEKLKIISEEINRDNTDH